MSLDQVTTLSARLYRVNSIMSQINNNNISLIESSCNGNNFDNQPENLCSSSSPSNHQCYRHRIVFPPSSEDGPSLPKYMKLSNSQQSNSGDNDNIEEVSSDSSESMQEEEQNSTNNSESSVHNKIEEVDQTNNLKDSLSSPNKTNGKYPVGFEVINDNSYGIVGEEVTLSMKEDSKKNDIAELDKVTESEESCQKSTNNLSDTQEHNSSSNSDEVQLLNGDNEKTMTIIKNPRFIQLPVANGSAKAGYVLDGNKLKKVDFQNNTGVVTHDHIYQLEQGNSNSNEMYQVANVTDCVEQNGLQGSKSYSFSELNLAQLILGLKQDIQDLTSKIEKQDNILNTVVHMNQFNLRPLFAENFPEKYGLQVPFTKLQDFIQFNNNLSKNIEICNEFIASLCGYIDNNVTLSKNILNMLRVYMSKELASLFTAVRPSGNKYVLKDTLFCKCLMQAAKLTIRHGLLPLEFEKSFMKHLGLAIGNARSWPHDDNSRENSQE